MRTITWEKIYQDIKDVFGSEMDETVALRWANRVLDDLRSTVNLPTQRKTHYVPYAHDFERYAVPVDYKTEGKISLKHDNKVNNNRDRVFDHDEPFEYHSRRDWKFLDAEEWNLREGINIATIIERGGKEALWLANGSGNQTTQLINDCDSLTGWTAGGGASNLTLDENVKAKGTYAINYDIASATVPELVLDLESTIDLSEYLETGIIRLYKWLPTVPTQIEIQIGESSSAYYTQTITAQSDGLPFDANDVNELELNFRDATITGTPDMTVVDHFKIILTYSSATTDTDFRIDEIKAYKAEYLQFDYYSFYMAQTSAGVWQEELTEVSGNDETINILPEWRKQFVAGCVFTELAKQGDARAALAERDYNEWITKLQKRYPNKSKKTGNKWY